MSSQHVCIRSVDKRNRKETVTRKKKRRVAARQAELDFRSWGGARRGAGRKPKGEQAGMPHVARPVHKARFPLLVTSRLRPGLRSLRHEREAECIRSALAGANRAAAAADHAGAYTKGGAPFQVVHYSIQSNHLHLIVEAPDRTVLTAGMRGLLVRIARALNRLWKRRGAVFADRFHERELLKPLQVRNALVYVLQNLRKHGIALAGPDPYSSGPEFDGWVTQTAEGSNGAWKVASGAGSASAAGGEREAERGVCPGTSSRFGGDRAWLACGPAESATVRDYAASGGPAPSSIVSLVRAARAEVSHPKTWLLGVGWKTHGLIDPRESPRRV